MISHIIGAILFLTVFGGFMAWLAYDSDGHF